MSNQDVIKCPKCQSNDTCATGIVYYSDPLQKEYLCLSCNNKFREVIPSQEPEGLKHQPDLKGCFNCAFYELRGNAYFICRKCGYRSVYTDICNWWEQAKE